MRRGNHTHRRLITMMIIMIMLTRKHLQGWEIKSDNCQFRAMLSFPLGNPKWSSCSFNEEIPLQEIAELTKWPLSFDWIELHLIWNIHCKLIELFNQRDRGKQLDHSIHACLANSDALTPDSGTQKKSKQKALSTLFKRYTLLSFDWVELHLKHSLQANWAFNQRKE